MFQKLIKRNAKRPLHVMEVIYAFSTGGSEHLASMIAERLVHRGLRVSVCAIQREKGEISERLERLGIPCYAICAGKRSKIRTFAMLYVLFRQQCVDVLHVHHVPMFRVCYWPARLAGVGKIVLTEHTDYEFRTNPKWADMARRYCARADMMTVVHEGLRNFFVERFGVLRQKIMTIPNGVDTERFSPGDRDPEFRQQVGSTEDSVLLGWIGRMHPDKDLGNLICAMRLVVETAGQGRASLLLIGDGEERKRTEALVAKLGLARTVHFLGERQDIPYLLRNIDLQVLSSRTEGLPLVILEAMSAGVPCVATAVGGVPEAVTKDVGVVIPPENSAALADGIIHLVRDAALRRQLGSLARKLTIDKYDINAVLNSYVSVLIT